MGIWMNLDLLSHDANWSRTGTLFGPPPLSSRPESPELMCPALASTEGPITADVRAQFQWWQPIYMLCHVVITPPRKSRLGSALAKFLFPLPNPSGIVTSGATTIPANSRLSIPSRRTL